MIQISRNDREAFSEAFWKPASVSSGEAEAKTEAAKLQGNPQKTGFLASLLVSCLLRD